MKIGFIVSLSLLLIKEGKREKYYPNAIQHTYMYLKKQQFTPNFLFCFKNKNYYFFKKKKNLHEKNGKKIYIVKKKKNYFIFLIFFFFF